VTSSYPRNTLTTAVAVPSSHPGEAGTRACWAVGCEQYECLTAADIDPVAVERYLRGEPFGRQMLTGDEREEVLRRQPYVDLSRGVRTHIRRGRLHYPHTR
jgi:hypothetical protein